MIIRKLPSAIAVAAVVVATVAIPADAQSSTEGPASGSASSTGAVTLEGVVRLRVADPTLDSSAHDEQLVLITDDTAYELTGAQATPNTRVRVTGTTTGDRLDATAVTSLGPAGDLIPPEGTTRVLVMLVHWREPDGVTPEQAAQQMFVDSDAWYDDASYGALGQTGDVTPWMRIDGPEGGRCYGDSANTMEQGKAAATALGYDLADYDNYVLYFPYNSWQQGSDCDGYAGWAYVGAPDLWINGFMDRRVTVHEQGHNYGLLHSHSYLCDQVIFGDCSWSDYGDDFDAMGASGLVGHFSASQKDLLGWIDDRTADLTDGGTATIVPFEEDDVAIVAARVDVSATRTYWFEYRQRTDFDASLPPAATDGALVHVVDRAISGDNGSNLLDLRPGDGLSVNSATLRPGQPWASPEGFTFAVDSVTSAGAVVTVALPVCPDLALEPDESRDQAGKIAVPALEQRAFCTPRDRDWVKFHARAGQKIRLKSSNLAPTADTFFTLYDQAGSKIARSDDVGGTLASKIVFTPAATGTYFLRVRQVGEVTGPTVTYDLRVKRV